MSWRGRVSVSNTCLMDPRCDITCTGWVESSNDIALPVKHLRFETLGERRRPLRIAYVGPAWGTSLHRARALGRLGHKVKIIDPWDWLGKSKWVSRWLHHAGGLGVEAFLEKPLFLAVSSVQPEVIFVSQGDFLGPRLLRRLRALNVPIINYTNDNPFSGRDGLRFRYYLKALPYYDLVVVVREENVMQAYRWGARQVMRVWMTADDELHQPRALSPELKARYASDVCFVGTWMPERGPFMAELIRRNIPLAIWGDNWKKASEWKVIKRCWRGPGLYDSDHYAAIIQSAKICLGLLSKGNRDFHTTRSMEIPALGGLLCAERTSEHMALYEEGEEAVFWGNAKECAAMCKHLLGNEALRKAIAHRGRDRAVRNNCFNEPMLGTILEKAGYAMRRSS